MGLMKQIIILEDNTDLADGLKDVIETALEHSVVITDSGSQAVKFAAEQGFDLGLFDINLPEMNGIAALKEIRRQGYSLPVIFMTGFRITQLINEVFPAAPVCLISEPHILDQLEHSQSSITNNAITLAYGTNSDELAKGKAFCLHTLGYTLMDARRYDIDDDIAREAEAYFYADVVVSDALAHVLYLREKGFEKPVIILGEYAVAYQGTEPYILFEVTGCVFKPFDLQHLLGLIANKLVQLD